MVLHGHIIYVIINQVFKYILFNFIILLFYQVKILENVIHSSS